MNATLTALQAHQQIEEFAQSAPAEMRFVPDGMAHPQWVRQGDVYLEAIDKVPADCDQETTNRQLAPGETRGSRHIIEGNVKLFVSSAKQPVRQFGAGDVLVGPVIVAHERCTLTHPEHAHFSLPAGTYQSYYQMDARQAERTRSLD